MRKAQVGSDGAASPSKRPTAGGGSGVVVPDQSAKNATKKTTQKTTKKTTKKTISVKDKEWISDVAAVETLADAVMVAGVEAVELPIRRARRKNKSVDRSDQLLIEGGAADEAVLGSASEESHRPIKRAKGSTAIDKSAAGRTKRKPPAAKPPS